MIFTREYQETWGMLNKFLFRFLFLYFVGYILLLFFGFFLEMPMRWFATNILHWGSDFKMEQTGSGDTTYNFILLAFTPFIAVLGTVVWTAIDFKRKSYNQLFYWFRVVLRLILFFFMMTYGFVKIFKTQFPDIGLVRLLQPVGDMSPMGLAWTYMGYSVAFNFFAGIAEIFGGLLMLYRKTVTLGALIIIGVMTHVAVMNFTYDIPVKLFSLHLIAMAVLLFSTDIKRFIRVFFKNKSVEKVDYYKPIKDKIYSNINFGMKILLLVVLVGIFSFQGITVLNTRKTNQMPPPFYGIWETQEFVINNDTITNNLSETERWRYLILDFKKNAAVKQMNDSIIWYDVKIDSSENRLSFYKNKEMLETPNFDYRFLDDETFQIKGTLNKDSLKATFKRKNLKNFRLISREFHWVNEYPYNR